MLNALWLAFIFGSVLGREVYERKETYMEKVLKKWSPTMYLLPNVVKRHRMRKFHDEMAKNRNRKVDFGGITYYFGKEHSQENDEICSAQKTYEDFKIAQNSYKTANETFTPYWICPEMEICCDLGCCSELFYDGWKLRLATLFTFFLSGCAIYWLLRACTRDERAEKVSYLSEKQRKAVIDELIRRATPELRQYVTERNLVRSGLD